MHHQPIHCQASAHVRVAGLAAMLCLAAAVSAGETNSIGQLQLQLQQMRENFERIQTEQRQQIEALSRRIDELSASTATVPGRMPQNLMATTGTNASPIAFQATEPASTPSASWSPAQPMTVMRSGPAYVNLSFDALLNAGWSTASDPSERLQLGDHDPSKRGFSMRNAEIALDGAVDPYFKGFANIALKLDNQNETGIELEEAYLLTTSLPANLQVKAGQFFANFGRQNPQHPHQWAFVDQPIILARAFGPDGLRNPGAQLSWLLPTPFYSEAFLGVVDGRGATAFNFRNTGENGMMHGRSTLDRNLRGPGDLLYVPRLAASFELTDQQTILVGTSAAFAPNDTGADTRTEIYGIDLYWKWKSARARAGFPFVSWQTEALCQRFEAGEDTLSSLPRETLHDWGIYSQLLWGFKPRWVAGLRGEFASGDSGRFDALDVFRGERVRVSPNLTFFPSEFSKLRLQYNYDQGEYFGTEHSIWLQVEFLLGAHGGHKF